MAASKKAVRKTSGGKTKPHTTATLKSVEITWTGQNGKKKKMTVDLNEASGIFWGDAGTIVWQGDKRRFPEARPTPSKGAQVKMSMSSATEDQALCWWNEVLQQWVCPVEPDA